jgi:DNA-binding LytR/AlgR family response regulator
MTQILLLEDEPLAANDMHEMLLKIRPDYHIVEIIGSVKKAISWLQNENPDLILSDIQLADGTCFEIFEKINKEIPIIFITAYNHYAIQAFKEFSIDYLLKPISPPEFEKALEKYEKLHPKINLSELVAIKTLLSRKNEGYQERFRVTYGENYLSVTKEEIAYFFSEDRYTYLVAKSGKQHIVSFNLSELENRLDPRIFFRINRKFIVNFDAIKKMTTHTKSRVRLELEPPLPHSMKAIVSVEKSGEFKEWLNK